MDSAETTVLLIIATLLTGCLTALIGTVFSMHGRFVRLEEGIRYVRRDIGRLQRDMSRRISGMHLSDDWSIAERESGDEKW